MSWQHSTKIRRSVGAEPYAPTTMRAITGRGERDDTCDHGLYVQKLESTSVQKTKNTLKEMINQQSAARRTSSKYKATQTFIVSHVPTRPVALDRQMATATESATTATIKHTAYILIVSREFDEFRVNISPTSLVGGKKHQTRTMRYGARIHATHWFLKLNCRLTTTFAWRSFTTGGTIIFSVVFWVENVWYTLAPCHKTCHI